MRTPNLLKRQFLKRWLIGLQASGSLDKNKNIVERKKAIKLSADLAMASTKNGCTRWSRAVLANASKQDNSRLTSPKVPGQPMYENLIKASNNIRGAKRLKKFLKKKRVRGNKVAPARSVAKRLVQKRTEVLRRLVPGGEFMDEICLIRETLDYIASLRVQVDVMRSLATVGNLLNKGS